MALPPHPQPVFPTQEVIDALADPTWDFTQFDTWKSLFSLAEKYGRRLYVTQYVNGCPASRYEVAIVANNQSQECPVVLFNAGGLFGDDFGNLGGSLILMFQPPIQNTAAIYDFRNPVIK